MTFALILTTVALAGLAFLAPRTESRRVRIRVRDVPPPHRR